MTRRNERTTSPWMIAAIVGNLTFWALNALHEWSVRGPFAVLGVDWARFWGASRAFSRISPAAAYDLPTIAAFMQPLANSLGAGVPGANVVRVGPAPYPPIFLELFGAFTWPPPLIGFALWTLVNGALAFFLLHGTARRAGLGAPCSVALLLLSTFPMMMALYVGQLVVLLLLCLTQAIEALEAERDFTAGVWTGLMMVKPQYAIWLLAVFVAKRRFTAVAGFATGSAVVVASSLAVGGEDGMTAYIRQLITAYPRYAGAMAIDPRGMISWRGLVIVGFPHLSTTASVGLVALLSVATLALLPLIWRGPWNPAEPRFARRMTATLIVTLLVAYHSQPHGAALLLVPATLMVARSSAPRHAAVLLAVATAATPVVGMMSVALVGTLRLVSPVIIALLIATLALIVRSELSDSREVVLRAHRSRTTRWAAQPPRLPRS